MEKLVVTLLILFIICVVLLQIFHDNSKKKVSTDKTEGFYGRRWMGPRYYRYRYPYNYPYYYYYNPYYWF